MVRAIGNGNDSALKSPEGFTPAAAAKTLPLVRRIVDDMIALTESIERQREQLRGLDDLTDTIEQSHYQEELSDIRVSLADDEQRFQKCLDELAVLGVEPHLPFEGFVDFPAKVQRRSVRLCWHPDDPTISHWHEEGEQAQRRTRIDDDAFESDSLA